MGRGYGADALCPALLFQGPALNSQNSQNHAIGREKLLGHLAMLLFAALIAGSFSVGDLAVPHLEPAALNSLRFFLGALLMGVVAFSITGSVPPFPKQAWRFAILGALMAAYFVLMFVALKISSPVSTGAVFTLIPMMSAGFGWLFLRQTTRPIVLFSLLIAAAGAVWVIFRGDIYAIMNFEIGKGEAIFFIGCAGHAAYVALVKKFTQGEATSVFAFYSLSATWLWITLVAIPEILTTDWTALPSIVWIGIAYLVIFTTATTFFLLRYAAVRLPASKVLSYGYLTPSFIILIEGLIGHGWVSLSVMAGALVTALALAVVALSPDS